MLITWPPAVGPEIDEVPALVLLPPELPVVLEFDVMVGPCAWVTKAVAISPARVASMGFCTVPVNTT